jgi:hypothetical protein
MKMRTYFIRFSIFFFLSSFHWSDAQVVFSSSNLPIIIIDTHGQVIPNEPKITADMGIIYNGPGVRNYLTDPLNHYNGQIGIEIRGSSTQMFPKKQYAMETRDTTGNNLNVSLLGMPEENDWNLYAPYSDKSLIRNVLAYKMSNDIERYASRTRFCEVVLNGDYIGLYVLMEKIKRDKNRVNIKKMFPTYITGNLLTGGYIIKIDKSEGSNVRGWYSTFPPYPGSWQQIYYQYHYPDPDEIVLEQETYIQNYIYQFESMMNQSTYTDPFTGYYDFIDINSFVDHFILNEIGKNVDAYRLSAFMFKDRDSEDGRLSMGPIWDFNLAFGNADYYNGWLFIGWQLNESISQDYWQVPFWWSKFLDDPVFMNRISRRWFEFSQDILSNDTLSNFIDRLTIELDEASIRNFTRWPVLGVYIWPNAFIGNSYEEEIEYLETWLSNRIYWMDNTLNPQYSVIDWINPDSTSFNAPPGSILSKPLNAIARNIFNIDSLTILSRDPSLKIYLENDSVYFYASQSGNYMFKGIGWKNGQHIEISPLYHFITNPSSIEEKNHPSETFTLLQNYPNPFNNSTTFKFVLAKTSYVQMNIFDVNGRMVSSVFSKQLSAGLHRIHWRNNNLSTGIYYYQVQADKQTQIKSLIIIK